MRKCYILFIVSITLSSCYSLQTSSGGGQGLEDNPERQLNPDDIALPDAYQIEVIAQDLTFPTGIAIDNDGTPYVTESGYSYGEVFKEPKLLRIAEDGSLETVASGEKNGPWNGVAYHKGTFYIAEGGQLEGGRIIAVDEQGAHEVLIEDYPVPVITTPMDQ